MEKKKGSVWFGNSVPAPQCRENMFAVNRHIKTHTAYQMALRVVIDMREDDLWRELEVYRETNAEGWFVEKKPLDVGDIAFYKEGVEQALLVLERKTAEDLGASQKDGRYREQRARLYAMRGLGTSIGYIVESPPWSPTLSRSWCRGAFTEVHLQQAIARLQLRHTIPVFQAAKVQETVQWIRRFAKALVTDSDVFSCGMAVNATEAAAAYTEAIHVKKAENNSPERIFLSFLLAIPGLGKASAEAVAKAAESSFMKLQAMTMEQLCDIQGGKKKIGKTIGSAIYAAIHS
jgi:ERCC4-type nuclease